MKCHREKPLLVRLVTADKGTEELWCLGCVYIAGRLEGDYKFELMEQTIIKRGRGGKDTYDT
jgi:hypothetical protein